MTPTSKIIDFDVLIPNIEGNAVVNVVKVQIPVFEDPETGEEILTPEAHRKIEETQAKYTGLLLPEEIKSLRRQLGWTQQQIASLLQIGDRTYTRWENGKDRPSRSMNVLLCALRDGRINRSYLESIRKPVFDWRTVVPVSDVVVEAVSAFQNADETCDLHVA